MKRKILLLDESLTVQKVVALTLDRERFTISNAKSRSEAMKLVLETPPDLILVSDQVSGLTVSSFPKEVETWVGRDRRAPVLILITNQDVREQKGFRSVLKKPFAPQALQAAVNDAMASKGEATEVAIPRDERTGHGEDEDSHLQKIFTETFSDEASLVSQTFQSELDQADDTLLTMPAPHAEPGRRGNRRGAAPKVEDVSQLWGKGSGADAPNEEGAVQLLGPEDSSAYKGQLEKEVRLQLESHDLESIVQRLLEKLVPPIVERVAQERLDKLLKETEGFADFKP